MVDETKIVYTKPLTPGESVQTRKKGEEDTSLVDTLKEYGDETKDLANESKTAWQALIQGIKEGNELHKKRVEGSEKWSDEQQRIIALFEDYTDVSEKSTKTMHASLQKDKGQQLEDKKETRNIFLRMLLRLVGIWENTLEMIRKLDDMKVENQGSTLLGKLLMGAFWGALFGLIAGIAVGFTQALAMWAIMWGRIIGNMVGGGKGGWFSRLISPITTFFKNFGIKLRIFFANWIKTPVAKLIAPITAAFTRMTTNMKNAWAAVSKGMKVFRNSAGRFASTQKSLVGGMAMWMKTTGDMWRNLKAGVDGGGKVVKLGGPLGKLFGGTIGIFAKFFAGLKTLLMPFWTGFRAVAGTFFRLGKLIGRLFFPLTIVMGLVDGIRGFIDGFKNQEGGIMAKLFAGIMGAIKGIVNGLIMMPLDLLKKGVAWIMGLFGFDGAKEALNSFSFKDLWSSLVDGIKNAVFAIVDWFKLLFSNPGQAIGNLVKGYGNMMMNLYKWILRMILPDPKGGKWYNPLSLIQKAIPDKVYTWAGLDPDTGEKLPDEVKIDSVNADDGVDAELDRIDKLDRITELKQRTKDELDALRQGGIGAVTARGGDIISNIGGDIINVVNEVGVPAALQQEAK